MEKCKGMVEVLLWAFLVKIIIILVNGRIICHMDMEDRFIILMEPMKKAFGRMTNSWTRSEQREKNISYQSTYNWGHCAHSNLQN